MLDDGSNFVGFAKAMISIITVARAPGSLAWLESSIAFPSEIAIAKTRPEKSQPKTMVVRENDGVRCRLAGGKLDAGVGSAL